MISLVRIRTCGVVLTHMRMRRNDLHVQSPLQAARAAYIGRLISKRIGFLAQDHGIAKVPEVCSRFAQQVNHHQSVYQQGQGGAFLRLHNVQEDLWRDRQSHISQLADRYKERSSHSHCRLLAACTGAS